jgi:hypothetical protein
MSTPETPNIRQFQLGIGNASLESFVEWCKRRLQIIRNLGPEFRSDQSSITSASGGSNSSDEPLVLEAIAQYGDDNRPVGFQVTLRAPSDSKWHPAMEAAIEEWDSENTYGVIIEPTEIDKARYAAKKDREYDEMPSALWQIPSDWNPTWEAGTNDPDDTYLAQRRRRRRGVIFDERVKLLLPTGGRRSCNLSPSATSEHGSLGESGIVV